MQQLVAQAEATSCVGARCCVPRLGQAAGGEDLERRSRDSHDLLGPLPVGQGNIHAGHEATKGHVVCQLSVSNAESLGMFS